MGKIDLNTGCPTDLAIDVAAQDLARYARICQENGLVPIVEPEILLDGAHKLETTAQIQERVLTTVYAKLQDNGVLLEGSLLKPSMTVPGVECEDKSDPATIAKMTVQTLDRCLPPAMPGVTFLSGGISEENSKKAQEQLLARAQANSEASLGKYVPGSQPSIEESLFVKNYAY